MNKYFILIFIFLFFFCNGDKKEQRVPSNYEVMVQIYDEIKIKLNYLNFIKTTLKQVKGKNVRRRWEVRDYNYGQKIQILTVQYNKRRDLMEQGQTEYELDLLPYKLKFNGYKVVEIKRDEE